MPDVEENVTRKLGPLPVWGWALVIGGGFVAMRTLRGGGTATAQPPLPSTGDTGGLDGANGADGADGAPGATGATGATGAAGTFPVGYTAMLNQITNWLQENDRSRTVIAALENALQDPKYTSAQKTVIKADLAAVKSNNTTTTYKVRGPVYTGASVYNIFYLTKTIDALQTQIAALK